MYSRINSDKNIGGIIGNHNSTTVIGNIVSGLAIENQVFVFGANAAFGTVIGHRRTGLVAANFPSNIVLYSFSFVGIRRIINPFTQEFGRDG